MMLTYIFCRAVLLRDMGDLTMAVYNLTQALKYKPNDTEALFQRAEIYETVSLIIVIHSFIPFL